MQSGCRMRGGSCTAAPKAPAAAAAGAGEAGERSRHRHHAHSSPARHGAAEPTYCKPGPEGGEEGGISQAPLFNGLDISSPSSSFIPRSDKPISTSRQESDEPRPVGGAENPRRQRRQQSRPGHVRGDAVIARPCPHRTPRTSLGRAAAAGRRKERSAGRWAGGSRKWKPGERKVAGLPAVSSALLRSGGAFPSAGRRPGAPRGARAMLPRSAGAAAPPRSGPMLRRAGPGRPLL
ncbi:uncharacterized protein LOC115909647 [Camarhynchus parvulus]|uniref:uncharacterized protein LOC115909647 n=1 Tax=Geospiza parvula TaxID=87175 RepID=UPI0012381B1B|nr:uncharacterized protein LOC115909647 [Camarhynchus parvulus]